MEEWCQGNRLRRDIGDYHVFCPMCLDLFLDSPGLNHLDWCSVVKDCKDCLGMNRAPIPLAEVMNIRGLKIGNEQ